MTPNCLLGHQTRSTDNVAEHGSPAQLLTRRPVLFRLRDGITQRLLGQGACNLAKMDGCLAVGARSMSGGLIACSLART